jgi:hypothetical protein
LRTIWMIELATKTAIAATKTGSQSDITVTIVTS